MKDPYIYVQKSINVLFPFEMRVARASVNLRPQPASMKSLKGDKLKSERNCVYASIIELVKSLLFFLVHYYRAVAMKTDRQDGSYGHSRNHLFLHLIQIFCLLFRSTKGDFSKYPTDAPTILSDW